MNTKIATAGVFIASLLTCTLSAADLNLGSSTSRTPYDPYLTPVWEVFRRLGGTQPDRAEVEQLVREGRGFRYVFKKEQPYVPQTPEQTEATKSGDCKAKSLWLASKMNCRNLRFVIGKFRLNDPQSHAWLIWEAPDGWLVLDATNYSRVLDPDQLSPSQLVPTYSYAPGGKYAHTVSAAGRGAKYGDHL
jgi:hypothetical protein